MKITKLDNGGFCLVFEAIELGIGFLSGVGLGAALGYFKGKAKGLEKAMKIIDPATVSSDEDILNVKWPFSTTNYGITANNGTTVKPAADYFTIEDI